VSTLSGLNGNKPLAAHPAVMFLFVNPLSLAGLYRGEMLLADCICTSSIQSFNLVAIGYLQGGKDSDVTGLELVGGVRGETTQDDVVFKVILQDLERLVGPEAVVN